MEILTQEKSITFIVDENTRLSFARYGQSIRWTLNERLVSRNDVISLLAINESGLSIIEACIWKIKVENEDEMNLTRACLSEARRSIWLPKGTDKSAPDDLRSVEVEKMHTGEAVYFLEKSNKVVYCGQTGNLAKRIAQHFADKEKVFDNVFFLKVPQRDRNKVERAWINKLSPKYNKTYGNL